jgi:Undecaprenyl-phosphate galactose phosphotransferase WbaP
MLQRPSISDAPRVHARMVEVGAILPPRTASKGSSRGWPRDDVTLIHRFRKPAVIVSLICGDVAAAIAAAPLSRALVESIGMALPHTRQLPVAFLILTFFCLGLYTGCGPSPYERFRLRTIGIAAFAAVDLFIGFPIGQPGPVLLARLCQAVLLLVLGHYLEAMVRTRLIQLGLWGAATAVVGCGDHSRKLAHLLLHQPALGLAPVGFIETPADGPLQKANLPLPLIGTTADPARAARYVEFAIFSSADELAAFASHSRGIMSTWRLLLVEDVQDIQSLWLRTRMLGEAIGIEIRRDLCLRHNQLFKRVIDILFTVPVALLASPIIAILALAIKLVNPGPAFYVQERVGHNGKTLRTFKLRTMYVDAEQRLQDLLRRDPQACAEWERFFKLTRDPRVLPIIGNFMRRASLDELPQLWNIIRGEMSLVGPRPFPAYHVNRFDDEFRDLRVRVQPGLTGMWQVSARSDGDLQVQKAQDLFYIKNWSIWLDMYILLQTVPAVLTGKGAR